MEPRQSTTHPRIRALLAGLAGAAVMATVLWTDGHFGLLGPQFLFDRWQVALGIHLAAGGVFGVAYSYLFDALGRAGWSVGITVGAVHGFFALALVSLAPSRHALYQLGDATGWGVVFIVALHVLFGGVVGSLYEPRAALHRRETTHAELEPEAGSRAS
jgi:hypothetical protein